MNRLRREGWAERLGNGSHVIFKKDGRRVVCGFQRKAARYSNPIAATIPT
jgi:predicted RNA binding protein YcfA (HicA-like mRNA interferase family)